MSTPEEPDGSKVNTSVGEGHFAIRYSNFWRLGLGIIGLGPSFSGVDLDAEELRMRFGWGFTMRAPRSSVARAGRFDHHVWYSLGAHTNLRGRWLVNGSGHGLVRIILSERGSGTSSGFPIHPHDVLVSLEDPDGFLAALGASPLGPDDTGLWSKPAPEPS